MQKKSYIITKRVFDFTVSFICLVIFSPLLILVSIILLLSGEHLVFFRQERLGLRNKPFKLIKFVTMTKASAKNDGKNLTTLPGDKRVLPVGRFLRKTNINELPQLINILKGEMSFVGPRPLLNSGWQKYPEHIRSKIYNVKPGMTGLGSVVFNDEPTFVASRKEDQLTVYMQIIFPYKGELEMYYQKHASMITDFKIIFLTAWVILFPKSKLYNKFFKNLPQLKA
ncbi:MAG TPA: sugar transferase [Salinivirgaceae bacterium]|nr:sugar transferase [Salinivirgaceae bacterium]